jgi:hypothetical protein
MKENVMKALVHAGLAGLAIYESTTATTKTRQILIGAAAGWHLNAVLYHLVYEKENEANE